MEGVEDTKPNGTNAEKKIENGNKFASPCEEESDADLTQEMVTSESTAPLKTPLKDVEVKFIVSDSINGDAKIDMDNVKSAFAGMAKEELMKYANDPFWIRMRLFLFIFFWVVWVAMFIGAIAIIIVAPRCEAPKRPEWYQQGPLYEVDLTAMKPGGKSLLEGLKSKLSYFVDLGVKGIILSPFFKASDSENIDVIDYKSIDNQFGTIEDFKLLAKEAKEKHLHIILSFVPNHSSDKHNWFNKSISKEAPYDKYYVWAASSGRDKDGERKPPNNWLSLDGGSAWEWNDERQEYYLHQFKINQPDLNFHNADVLKEFNDTLLFWLELGTSGFNLDRVQYLLEDPDLANAANSIPAKGFVHTEYGFYNHMRTHNLPDVAKILSSWRQTIHKRTAGQGVLIINGDAPESEEMNKTSTIVDLTRSSGIIKDRTNNLTANDLHEALNKIVSNDLWSSVELGSKKQHVTTRFGDGAVDGLNMLLLLLPGTPITYLGEELGLRDSDPFPWGNETNRVSEQKGNQESHYSIYQAMVEARDTPAVINGEANLKVLNDSLLTLTRIKSGSPGYLVVFNTSPKNVTGLHSLDKVPEELTIYAKSVNYGLDNIKVKDKVKRSEITFTPNSALVFTFVPVTKE